MKRKLQRFAEMKTFPHVFQPVLQEVFNTDYKYKGKWNEKVFKNSNPVVVELGCGKGEYTVGLAERNPDKNFIGIDIKGARIWKGAKKSLEQNMSNVAFVRTHIEFVASVFAPGEVSEIWLTFPDPQPKKPLKRLSSSRFLTIYKNLLQKDGFVHLKTDNADLYEYTAKLAEMNKLDVEVSTDDLYHSALVDDVLSIKTFYEARFIKEGKTIKYIRFRIPKERSIREPEKTIKDDDNK